MLKKLILATIAVALVFVSQNALAQNQKVKISGVVSVDNTKGVLGAIVYLKSSYDLISWSENKTMTDSSGYYEFSDLASGMTHTLTVLRSGYIFTPNGITLMNVRENKVQNFTTIKNVDRKYSVSGYIRDKSAAPISGVTVMLNRGQADLPAERKCETDINGFYKFDDLDSSQYYILIPKKDKYVFTPPSQVIAGYENRPIDFTGAQIDNPIVSISGYIRDENSNPAKKVVLILFGYPFESSTKGRAETDSNGFYKFDNLEAGRYFSVVPMKEGYIFNPQEKTYEFILKDEKQDFVIKQDLTPRYSLSGYVKDENSAGVANVTMRLNGLLLSSISHTATTNYDGYYKFENLKGNIGYVLSPFKDGCGFNPEYKVIENLSGDLTQNFAAIVYPMNLTISGYVKDQNSNPIDKATIIFSGVDGLERTTTTDANGYYQIIKVRGGQSAKLMVYKEDYSFDPSGVVLTNILKDVVQNFTGKKRVLYSIKGKIAENNITGILGVRVLLSGGSYNQTVSDSSGNYELGRLAEGFDYIVTPVKYGYEFEPKSATFNALKENKTLNFSAKSVPVVNYTVSGYVKDRNSIGIEGVILFLNGTGITSSRISYDKQAAAVTTNSSGFYKFENVEPGVTYFITIRKEGYSFNPNYAIIENLNGDKTQNFVGAVVSCYSINGYTRDKDLKPIPGVSILVGGETKNIINVVTDSNGYYKIDKLETGRDYCIMPSKSNYKFEPSYVKINKGLEESFAVTRQDFTGTKVLLTRYTIFGYIEDNNSNKMAGVTVLLKSDVEVTTVTDNKGFFAFEDVEEGKSYTITPLKDGYNFYPPVCNLFDMQGGKALNSVGLNNLTSVNNIGELPSQVKLYQNYPNPFNPTTTIEYELNKAGLVNIKVYDMLGREIYNLFNGYQNSGIYKLVFDARNLSSGKYFIRLQTGDISKMIGISLMK